MSKLHRYTKSCIEIFWVGNLNIKLNLLQCPLWFINLMNQTNKMIPITYICHCLIRSNRKLKTWKTQTFLLANSGSARFSIHLTRFSTTGRPINEIFKLLFLLKGAVMLQQHLTASSSMSSKKRAASSSMSSKKRC